MNSNKLIGELAFRLPFAASSTFEVSLIGIKPIQLRARIVILFVLLHLFLSAKNAEGQSGVFFDNGTGISTGVAGAYSDPKWPQFIAGEFSVSSSQYYLTSIQWFGFYETSSIGSVANDPATPDNFTIDLFEFSLSSPNSNPSQSILSGASVTRTLVANHGGESIFQYDLSVQPILLQPNTPYLLGISNDNGDLYWIWNESSGVTGAFSYSRTIESSVWVEQSPGNAASFNLSGYPVPESSTLALLSIGLTAALIARRPNA